MRWYAPTEPAIVGLRTLNTESEMPNVSLATLRARGAPRTCRQFDAADGLRDASRGVHVARLATSYARRCETRSAILGGYALALGALLPAVAWLPDLQAVDGSGLSAVAAPGIGSGRALLEQLLDVLATGDQGAYERFVQATYTPAALAEYPAEDHAASLARI